MGPGPKPGPFDSFDDAAWTGAFEMCLLSYIRTIRAVLPSMRRLGGGRIVNSTSSSVRDCLDNLILSNTMRMGVVGMSKTLAKEVGKDKILVNVIGPGRIGTDRITSLNAMRAELNECSGIRKGGPEVLPHGPLRHCGRVWPHGRLPVLRGQHLYLRSDHPGRRRYDRGLLTNYITDHIEEVHQWRQKSRRG